MILREEDKSKEADCLSSYPVWVSKQLHRVQLTCSKAKTITLDTPSAMQPEKKHSLVDVKYVQVETPG